VLKRLVAFLLPVAAALALTPAYGAATVLPDRIELHSGRRISGITVTKADIDVVLYRVKTTEKAESVAASEVKEISWGDAGQFRQAISLCSRGDWERARQVLEQLPAGGPRMFWYGPYKGVLHGQCLVALGEHKKALPLFEGVIRGHANSFYVLEAIFGKAKAHEALKQYREAAETYKKLDRQAYGALWRLRGRFCQAETYAKAGGADAANAEATYADLADETEAILADPPEHLKGSVEEITRVHQSCLIGKATVLLAGGKPEEAHEWLVGVSDKITDEVVRVRMYVRLGDAMTEAAKGATGDRMNARYKKALLAYMRVYVLYRHHEDNVPKAMLNAATISRLLGTGPDKARAVRLGRELVSEFPGAPEAAEARRLLEGLGVGIDR